MTKKPAGITITAWFWIVMGALVALSALMGGPTTSAMDQAGAPPPPPEARFGVLAFAQAALALLAIAAGVALLYLKAWARTALEVLSWLALLYCAGFAIFWIYLWISMTGDGQIGEAPFDIERFEIMGAIMGLIVAAVFAVPLGFMVRYLRGKEARAAVSGARPAQD